MMMNKLEKLKIKI